MEKDANYRGLSRDKRIERGKEFPEKIYRVLTNDSNRSGRNIIERKIFNNLEENWRNEDFSIVHQIGSTLEPKVHTIFHHDLISL